MTEPTRGWKSDEERGPTGAWFVRAIGERSIEQVAKDMTERGHVHKPDYYRGIMSGSKKPGRVLLAALQDYLGSKPDAKETGSDQSDLAAAIRENTAMLERVLKALMERMPPSPEPPPGAVLEGWSEAERRLSEERTQGGSLPRRPARDRRTEDRATKRREAEPAS